MEQQQLKQLMQQAYTTTKKPQTFSKNQKDVIAYFFFRLQNTYGISRMQSQWPDDNSLSLAKREFGKSIAKMSREEINALFDELHAENGQVPQRRRENMRDGGAVRGTGIHSAGDEERQG